MHFSPYLLTRRVMDWAMAVWDSDTQVQSSYSHFMQLIRDVFEHPAGIWDISLQLLQLRQGGDTAADYAPTFVHCQHKAAGRPGTQSGILRGPQHHVLICHQPPCAFTILIF